MTYIKPEVSRLGSASLLIQGGRGPHFEGSLKKVQATIQSDGELDE
jgi:hypothetical protein